MWGPVERAVEPCLTHAQFGLHPLAFRYVVEVAGDAEASVRDRDALDPPVIRLDRIDVGAVFDGIFGGVGLAGREGAPEVGDRLAREPVRPNLARRSLVTRARLGRVRPDQAPAWR
jgi:hypothetical protein